RRKTHAFAQPCRVRKTAQGTVGDEVGMARTEDQGIENEVLVDKSDGADDPDGEKRPQDMGAQLRDVFEERHFVLPALHSFDFVLLVECHICDPDGGCGYPLPLDGRKGKSLSNWRKKNLDLNEADKDG
ncbi:MAG: hypothetical protein KDC61_13385, partial [Saprospiraceae bacterium]|nr:hypothetical protein [Saprospiraceae bacterium]